MLPDTVSSSHASLRDSGCDVICFGNSTNIDVAAPRVTRRAEVELLVQQRIARWRRGPTPPMARAASGNGRKAKRKAS